VKLALFYCMCLWGTAAAHPLEPQVTGTPMTVPPGMVSADVGFSLESPSGEKGLSCFVAGGFGRGELTVGTTYDVTEQRLGGLVAGGKLLILMEGPRGVDLAISALVSSEGAGRAGILVGRTVVPGLYLSAQLAGGGANPPSVLIRHGGIGAEPGTTFGELSAAAQWAPIPRLLPVLELSGRVDAGGTTLQIVPELVALPLINNLAVKLAVPVGVIGDTRVALLAQVAWEK
jgi:hypothetical protein